LGPAPRWCSFLDNLVEEVEETETDTIYDDYKFVTIDELKKLSLDSLVGTNLLRAYMHGYFIDNRLYQKAKTQLNPFALETYKQEEIDKKIREETKRAPIKKKVKVNADKFAEMADSGKMDSRFANMFKDENFVIDPTSERAQLLKPVSAMKKVRRNDDDSSDEENEQIEQADIYETEKATKSDDSFDESENESEEEIDEAPKAKVKKVSLRGDARNFTSIHAPSDKLIEQRQKAEEMTLADRLKKTKHDQVEHIKGGKVFTLEREKKTRDVEIEKKKKDHMKDRRKGARSGTHLLKKHRPAGMGKSVKK